MSIPSQGHGDVVLMQCEGGHVQLRDDFTRFWCACGQPAVAWSDEVLPQYNFKCIKCNQMQSERMKNDEGIF